MLTIYDVRERAKEDERRYVIRMLERSDWRIARAAAMMGCMVSAVQSLIKRHGLGEMYAEGQRLRRERTAEFEARLASEEFSRKSQIASRKSDEGASGNEENRPEPA